MSLFGRDSLPPPSEPEAPYQRERSGISRAGATPEDTAATVSEYEVYAGGASAGTPTQGQWGGGRFGRVGVTPWTLAQTLAGTAITLVPWMLFIALSQAAKSPQTTHTQRLPVVQDAVGGVIFLLFTAVVEGAFLLAPAYYVFSRRASGVAPRARLAALGLRRTPLLPAILWVLAGIVFIVFVVGWLYDVFLKMTGLQLQTNVQTLMQEAKFAPLTVTGALLGAVFIAPFCEEIFFRGFLFAGLLRGMPVLAATLLSALLFAIAHGDLGSFLPLFVIGLALAVVRWRTGAIWPGMALHACNNALAALSLLPLLLR